MDPLSFDVSATVELIKRELKGKDAAIAQRTEVDAEKVWAAPAGAPCSARAKALTGVLGDPRPPLLLRPRGRRVQIVVRIFAEPIGLHLSYLDLRTVFALVVRGQEAVRSYREFAGRLDQGGPGRRKSLHTAAWCTKWGRLVCVAERRPRTASQQRAQPLSPDAAAEAALGVMAVRSLAPKADRGHQRIRLRPAAPAAPAEPAADGGATDAGGSDAHNLEWLDPEHPDVARAIAKAIADKISEARLFARFNQQNVWPAHARWRWRGGSCFLLTRGRARGCRVRGPWGRWRLT